MDNNVLQAIIAILAGLIGVPVINLLKRLLGWKDERAMLLTVFVAIVLSAVALFISGGISFSNMTWDTARNALGTVLMTATITYNLLPKPSSPEGPPTELPGMPPGLPPV